GSPDVIRFEELDVVFVFKLPGAVEGQEMIAVCQLREVTVVGPLVQGDEVAHHLAPTRDQIRGKARQRGSGAAPGQQCAQVASDVHAVELPAVVKVPRRLEPGPGVAGVNQSLGEWAPGYVTFECAVLGQARLV